MRGSGRTAVQVTQQYLIGETCLLLARMQEAAPDTGARELALLRHEAEESAPWALAGVAARALRIADGLCWQCLERGDLEAFSRQCACAAELRAFCVCAQLIPDG